MTSLVGVVTGATKHTSNHIQEVQQTWNFPPEWAVKHSFQPGCKLLTYFKESISWIFAVILFFTHLLTSLLPFNTENVLTTHVTLIMVLFYLQYSYIFSLLLLKWLVKPPHWRKTPFCWCGQYGNAQREQLFQVHKGTDSDISPKRLSFILVSGLYIILRSLWSLNIMLNHTSSLSWPVHQYCVSGKQLSNSSDSGGNGFFFNFQAHWLAKYLN